MKKHERKISGLDDLMPDEVLIDSLAYLEARYDLRGPRTHEYALKVARSVRTRALKAGSALGTSTKH